jgi:hypothetical protein
VLAGSALAEIDFAGGPVVAVAAGFAGRCGTGHLEQFVGDRGPVGGSSARLYPVSGLVTRDGVKEHAGAIVGDADALPDPRYVVLFQKCGERAPCLAALLMGVLQVTKA